MGQIGGDVGARHLIGEHDDAGGRDRDGGRRGAARHRHARGPVRAARDRLVSADGAGGATAPRTRDDLYHQAIVELARQAAGAVRLDAPQASAMVDNPLCGDRVTIELALADGRVQRGRPPGARLPALPGGGGGDRGARAGRDPGGAARGRAARLERAVRTDPAAPRRPVARARARSPRSTATRAGTTACCCRSRRWSGRSTGRATPSA